MGEILMAIIDEYHKEIIRKFKTESGKLFIMINFIMVIFAWLTIITIFKILFLLYKTNFVRPINKLVL